jgi:putative ABC transport system permease protein
VSQRTREFGIRAALGAAPGRVMSLVLHEGISLTLPGVAVGLAGAAIAGRLLSSGLVGVSAADPPVYAASATLQTLVALLACLLPAYRATKADPMLALRVE